MSNETQIDEMPTVEVVANVSPPAASAVIVPPTPAPEAKASIVTSEAGLFLPKTIDESFRLAKAYLASKMLPARFTTAEMVMTAMQYALELRLPPLISLKQIAVVQGTPSVFGDLPLTLVYRSGLLEEFDERYFDKDGREITLANGNIGAEVYAAYCSAKRKGDPKPAENYFTIDEAKTAGLLGNPVWTKYRKRMLRYRARSQVLKDKFPDALNGVAIAEYDFNTLPDDETGATPNEAATLAAKLRG